ncbi:hypothetical protein CDL12_01491 [Handroanthus impetiginosus]|uniref:Uncharacterized protein n=1 Tax=Handroanthus impetiginosus TaxID=429701 RepID=A0A2G9I7N2_9LAMI|nr:hypothetical protein CDL12_01491 [Handroanthus impetiginosus]
MILNRILVDTPIKINLVFFRPTPFCIVIQNPYVHHPFLTTHMIPHYDLPLLVAFLERKRFNTKLFINHVEHQDSTCTYVPMQPSIDNCRGTINFSFMTQIASG